MLRADRGGVATGGESAAVKKSPVSGCEAVWARMEYIRGLCTSTMEGVAKINTATRWTSWLHYGGDDDVLQDRSYRCGLCGAE